MGGPALAELYVASGQTLLLCSDGLHRGLTAEQIGQILGEAKNLAEAARQLACAARIRGSNDDISVLLAQRNSGEAKVINRNFLSALLRW